MIFDRFSSHSCHNAKTERKWRKKNWIVNFWWHFRCYARYDRKLLWYHTSLLEKSHLLISPRSALLHMWIDFFQHKHLFFVPLTGDRGNEKRNGKQRIEKIINIYHRIGKWSRTVNKNTYFLSTISHPGFISTTSSQSWDLCECLE